MALADQIASDYLLMDGVVSVTHTSMPSGTAKTSVKALRRPVRYGASAGGPPLSPESVGAAWHLWVATMSGAVARPGDTITESGGTVWIVIDCSLETLGTRWRCLCQQSR